MLGWNSLEDNNSMKMHPINKLWNSCLYTEEQEKLATWGKALGEAISEELKSCLKFMSRKNVAFLLSKSMQASSQLSG